MIDLVKSSHVVMDVDIAAVTMDEAIGICEEMTRRDAPHLIATANAEMLMIARKNETLRHVLNSCDLVVPDGAGILWAGEQLGTPFPERVAGADLAEKLLLLSPEKGWPVYFLGGAPGVAEKAARRFGEAHGKLILAGVHDGYFDKEEEQRIIRDIREHGTKLLFVGMGVPKQETWLYEHKDELGPVVAMGVGGVFDIMAGNLKRAPLWMQKNRLEWAYRLFLQPSRIGRMMALPRYMQAVRQWKKERAHTSR